LAFVIWATLPDTDSFGFHTEAGEWSYPGILVDTPGYYGAPLPPQLMKYGNREGWPLGLGMMVEAPGFLNDIQISFWEAQSSLAVSGDSPTTIEIPLLGKLDVKGYSLLVLAIMLGLIDGFNPCAMWALVYLISIVISLNDKWKVWLIVGTFVFSSGVWYFLFMSAWLNVFLFFGYIRPITFIIGLIAVYVGTKGFVDLIKNRGAAACTVTDDRSREKTINRMKRILLSPVSFTSLFSIIGLSFIVNSIEFVCSCAIPAVFTHVLSISSLTWAGHYGYILLYIFFFMLDDLIIFGSAAFAFNTLIGNRYVVYCKILGGILLVALGILLIFLPHVLLLSK
jgi:hypothetical protein